MPAETVPSAGEAAACPFCQHRKTTVELDGGRGSFVACDNCGARGPWTPTHLGRNAAIAEWNRRAAAPASEPSAMRVMKACKLHEGMPFVVRATAHEVMTYCPHCEEAAPEGRA